MRTNINKLIDYISSCALLHQHQRKKDEYGRVIANWFDYDIGLYVFNELEGINGSTLNKRERELVDVCEPGIAYTVAELSTMAQIPKAWFYEKHMEGLVDRHIFKTTEKEIDAGALSKNVQAYELSKVTPSGKSLPFSDEIKDKSPIFGDFLPIVGNDQQEDFTDFTDFLERRKKLISFIQNDVSTNSPPKSAIKSTKPTKSIYKDVQKIGTKSTENQEPKIFQSDRIQVIRENIEKDRKAKYKIDDEYLYHNFNAADIDSLIQSGMLIKLPDGQYAFNNE